MVSSSDYAEADHAARMKQLKRVVQCPVEIEVDTGSSGSGLVKKEAMAARKSLKLKKTSKEAFSSY